MPELKKLAEADLVDQLKKRHQSAFVYLYENYAGALHTVVTAVVIDRDSANDVLQEVFVKIWKQIESYDENKGRLFTWMTNIARNAAIDMVRSKEFRKSQKNRELTEDVYMSSEHSATTPIERIGLRKLVHQLKDDHKVLVELSYFQGFTQEEIAKMLEIPLGTVKTRLRAALIQLKKSVKV
ncbi:RNA polymerase sigma-70 factor, ECF subfamily [Filimonas lacunae]|uniref:RNA polymerase sigma-70 factor, ECF subfamily n=1 Tax=Filimonas lacunae TaxID=477680 RepID=A0A173MNI6_9BACT|nr:sigma-70 family RNA polymerase sigma factor [Filimonas lacunae]BAV09225.1 RNA polymerase sigma-70 factor [Filimonas lacunae]SIS69298.1 RNA polymerase sigma-70 factor, ECF subfamily [Filimonas lacunae]